MLLCEWKVKKIIAIFHYGLPFEKVSISSGTQPFAKDAPLTHLRLRLLSDEQHPGAKQDFVLRFHAGAISENVYLYCASKGLATVVRESIDKPPSQSDELRPEQKITLGQPIRYPSK